jgi:hypothetical protein
MAASITEILREPAYANSPLGRAESELTESRGARRHDLVIFSRLAPAKPLVTAELKLPWRAEGRTPYNSQLVSDAHAKASRAGSLYFMTSNVRRIVVWKTDDPGVELERRVIYDHEISASAIRSEADLERSDTKAAIGAGIRDLVQFLHTLVTGPSEPVFLPLDKIFIANLEAALYFPVEATIQRLQERLAKEPRFRILLERWMREEQGWIVSKATEDENVERAARFSCYVLVNRLCFYNALRRKYDRLPRLVVPNSITTGAMLRNRLDQAFADAKRFTGDYETVFDGDFGDDLPFLADEATGEWRRLVRSLDRYDFASMSIDVIGAMYEQLIQPEERHRYGQHYTQPPVVDLINAFSVNDPDASVLDPACGGGTFLVRAYARKRYLNPEIDHSDLLAKIYGCDLLSYACHLSTINLAVRDLIDDDNFPRVHHGDFLRYQPGQVFSEQPRRLQAGGLVLSRLQIGIQAGQFDAIVGNPPYISARDLPANDRGDYLTSARQEWPRYNWRSRSDIYVYFWTHSARFLKEGGILALLTQAGWLDTDYGFPLQAWMLDNFRIEAILESESEPWFTDARVATVITILVREKDRAAREDNDIRFVQFRSRLLDLIGGGGGEASRQAAVNRLRDLIRSAPADVRTEEYRIRLVNQGALHREGVDSAGEYSGSKWGRYLRSIDSLYELQQDPDLEFVQLGRLAQVRRGVTTNCDDFFIVSDVTDEALERVRGDRTFREIFRVSRKEVVEQGTRIVRRADGLEAALEPAYLRPILKSGRDAEWISTGRIGTQEYAVVLTEPRDSLSRLARAYVEAGEREGWHRSPSFRALADAGGDWYVLQHTEVAPILLIKTMQYAPVTLWNDGGFIANQRLYNVVPLAGSDAAALCAILNSTVFAAERYAAVKALGREAAIDLEVFAASILKTPHLRKLRARDADRLQSAFAALSQRKIQPMLEEALQDSGLAEARSYAARQPVGRDAWPGELRDGARQEIDRIVLRGLGIPASEIEPVRERLYNELLAHTRKLRLLELEAQRNRRGGRASAPSPRELADEIWSRLLEEGSVALRKIPQDFLRDAAKTEVFNVPAGNRFSVLEPSLFDTHPRFAIRVGNTVVEARNREQADYLLFLLERGVSGGVPVPVAAGECARATAAMKSYWEELSRRIASAAAEVTGSPDLQSRIEREALRRLSH